ncbi:hypothetical protein ACGF0J_10760 [Nonomuraea sp. NPDC047897]|uniref:hypothetical protein n=1 Tax=Nonomuraea sp. NPDC047897 TaxID=3364346 RepID=UPI00371FAA71
MGPLARHVVAEGSQLGRGVAVADEDQVEAPVGGARPLEGDHGGRRGRAAGGAGLGPLGDLDPLDRAVGGEDLHPLDGLGGRRLRGGRAGGGEERGGDQDDGR